MHESALHRAARRPLAGVRVAVTRAAEQATPLLRRLAELGADALSFPAIATVAPPSFTPIDESVAALDRFDWVLFTSANAVRVFSERLVHAHSGRASGSGSSIRALVPPRIGAVGDATAAVLRRGGLAPDLVAEEFHGSELASALGDLRERRVLLPRGDLATPDLPAALRHHGAEVHEVVAYRTVAGPGIDALVERLRAGTLDVVTFFSPSAVRFLSERARVGVGGELLPPDRPPAIICVGPTTAAAARELGIAVSTVADRHDDEGMVDAMLRWRRSGGSQ